MTIEEQEKVFDKLKALPCECYGWREITALYWTGREIQKTDKVDGKRYYMLESDAWIFYFCFEWKGLKIVG